MQKRAEGRDRRHLRVRKTVAGTPERPRLNIFRSAKHIYAQLVDDAAGRTLLTVSTLSVDFKATKLYGGNVKAATEVGRLLAGKALEKGIQKVVFDRGGFLYHGRVQALAEGAREKGLQF